MELNSVGRLIKAYWLRVQSKFYALSLILVQLTAAKFFLSFLLECDDYKTDKDIHHEESDYDDIYDVIDANQWTIVKDWAEPR
jgi:hypothetical protein